jgi:hypothetical protein
VPSFIGQGDNGPDEPGPSVPAEDKQPARFRVSRCERDERNRLVDAREVPQGKATITWTVHLVNRKAAGEAFPPDTDPAAGERPRRNPHEAYRAQLVIDPGPRSLTGPARWLCSTRVDSRVSP